MKTEEIKTLNATEEAPQRENGQAQGGLTKILYRQLDILQAEQEKVCHPNAELEVSTKNTRAEKLAFSEQIRKTAEAIIMIKRRKNQ